MFKNNSKMCLASIFNKKKYYWSFFVLKANFVNFVTGGIQYAKGSLSTYYFVVASSAISYSHDPGAGAGLLAVGAAPQGL